MSRVSKTAVHTRDEPLRVLILGATGVLGHKLYQVLNSEFDVWGTIRHSYRDIARYGFFDEQRIVTGFDVLDIERVQKVIGEVKPQVVINAIGIVKSLEKERGILLNIAINSLFPHQLYRICHDRDIRLIHISTDCVFSGRKGGYREDDPSDAEDIYGKTKYLGEVNGEGALTIRTSFIGRELATVNGLVEWFLSNQGKRIDGFTNAIYTGFPTLHLARIITDIISHHTDLHGIYHISSQPISKFRLLYMIKEAMGLNIEIGEYPDYRCDRSLDSTMFRQKTGFRPPSWQQMIAEFVADMRQYREWRTT